MSGEGSGLHVVSFLGVFRGILIHASFTIHLDFLNSYVTQVRRRRWLAFAVFLRARFMHDDVYMRLVLHVGGRIHFFHLHIFIRRDQYIQIDANYLIAHQCEERAKSHSCTTL